MKVYKESNIMLHCGLSNIAKEVGHTPVSETSVPGTVVCHKQHRQPHINRVLSTIINTYLPTCARIARLLKRDELQILLMVTCHYRHYVTSQSTELTTRHYVMSQSTEQTARLIMRENLCILLMATHQYQALCYVINSANHIIIRIYTTIPCGLLHKPLDSAHIARLVVSLLGLPLNLGTNDLKVTAELLPMAGQAGCYQGQDRSAVTHAGVKTEDVLHGFTHAQYDRKRIVYNTVASPVEHGRRGCPGAETFW
ncbi:hypothetical protein J6590_085276 [Homalodisca vitripennis]|nr:hypothetical protein J6590_085276 [Homalodisca vitripennis]